MNRELLVEIGCEELPAGWLPALAHQVGEALAARLAEARLSIEAPIETFSTPRRLTARVARLADRQADLEETVTGPPVSAGFGPSGTPTPAALGFARKHGVQVSDLIRVTTPKGEYLAHRRRMGGKPTVDVLPGVLASTLRGLTFPKQMHWDAWLDDGRGELTFGRPIRWILFLYGGHVVPFAIRRGEVARAGGVDDVRSGAVTYGHRFLATKGRAGRAVRVRSFSDYRARLAEHCVLLDRHERRDKIARELNAHARSLGGHLPATDSQTGLLAEVPDLVEYPSVVAGTFSADFLTLPEEVLTTTMIHHQHFFPVVGEDGRLKPSFLAVTNTQPDGSGTIARNAERVLTARLRDAAFFWDADRKLPLASRLERLDTLLFHQKLGSYREKTARVERLAGWIATHALGAAGVAPSARTAAQLAKADLGTEMVGEFPELQGIMGGIYAREEGQPPAVWRAIYYHYLPTGVEAEAAPARADLADAALSWAAVALADKLDTVVGLFSVGEEPTGSRDPFGLRRQGHGIVKILVDAPELVGVERPISLDALLDKAWEAFVVDPGKLEARAGCAKFLHYRLRYLLKGRGFRHDEVSAALSAMGPYALNAQAPVMTRRRAEAIRAMRGSTDFEALAVLFKRVKNMAREISAQPKPATEYLPFELGLLKEPAEQALLREFQNRKPVIEGAIHAGEYRQALAEASKMRGAVDRFFAEVFVMVEDKDLKRARQMLTVSLRDLIMGIADISEIGEEEVWLE